MEHRPVGGSCSRKRGGADCAAGGSGRPGEGGETLPVTSSLPDTAGAIQLGRPCRGWFPGDDSVVKCPGEDDSCVPGVPRCSRSYPFSLREVCRRGASPPGWKDNRRPPCPTSTP